MNHSFMLNTCMKLVIAIAIGSLLTGCSVFKSRDERYLLKNGIKESVSLKKEKARVWRTSIAGVGEGKVIKGRMESSTDYEGGLFRSTVHTTSARSYTSEVRIGTDTLVAIMKNGEVTSRSRNTFLNQKLLGSGENNAVDASAFSDLSFFWVKNNDVALAAWATPAIKGYSIRRLSPQFSVGDAFHSRSNRLIIYNGKDPVGLVRLKGNKNIIYLKPGCSTEDRKLVNAIGLAVKKSALRNPKQHK